VDLALKLETVAQVNKLILEYIIIIGQEAAEEVHIQAVLVVEMEELAEAEAEHLTQVLVDLEEARH
jgi:hypothetical protein